MNIITLTGNICNVLELKQTNSGKAVCNLSLAVKRPYTSDITDFMPIVVWGKQAEHLCMYCGKGSKIAVTGVLTTRKWEDKDGNNRVAYEVVANSIEFLSKKGDGQGQSGAESTAFDDSEYSFADYNDEDCPF